MVGVGDQQHGGGGRGRGDHLPHQPAGVDHRLADAHAVAAAGIQHQSLPGGIEVDVEDAGKLHVQPRALGAGQQAAQPRVLRRRRLQARIARARDQQRIAQQFVVAHQLAAGHRVLAQGHARARRQPGQPPQRLHRDFRLRPRRAQPAAAVVQHHQHHRQHQIRQQAQHAGDIAGAGCGRSGVGRHVSGSANAVAVRNSGEAAVWPMEGPTQAAAGRLRSRTSTTLLVRRIGVGHGWPISDQGINPARRTRCRACRPAPAHARHRAPRRSADRPRPARAGRFPR